MSSAQTLSTFVFRFFAWCVVTITFAFVLNVYLTFWRNWPGTVAAFSGGPALAWLQLAVYGMAIAGSAAFVLNRHDRSLRQDSEAMSAISAYIVRAAFWTVLLVGIADAVVSFLRVEGMLTGLVGSDLDTALGRNAFRGPVVHLPMMVLAVIIAFFRRSLDFIWLALLVVLAELVIVITRFVFSYEQAFMGDLVRFWYAALFLFASAYTLIEEGHVRVDILYSGFDTKRKGLVNALGSLLLGISLCVVVIFLGMGNKQSIITSPLLALEITQSGFGMYVKYMMAGFLGIFAISMIVQFASYMLEGIADHRGDPGHHKIEHETVY